jgi:hypothetical protein
MTHLDIIGLLKKKGWKNAGTNANFIFMSPPKDLGFRDGYKLSVAANSTLSDYEDALSRSISVVEDIYEKEIHELIYDIGNYAQVLKKSSFFFRLASMEPKYKQTLNVDDIWESLKGLSNSFSNYAVLGFQKRFSESFKGKENELMKLIKKIRLMTGLRLTDLEFRSFGAGVATDTIMNSENFTDSGMRAWRKSLVKKYEEEVLNVDFNSQEDLERINRDFSPIEREQIFGPLMKVINKKELEIQITNSKYQPKKTYKKIPKSTIDKIIPKEKTVKEDDPDMHLVQVLVAIDKNKTSHTFKTPELEEGLLFKESESFTLNISSFDYEGSKVDFKNDANFNISLDKITGLFQFSIEELDIEVSTDRLKDIQSKVKNIVSEKYNYYLDIKLIDLDDATESQKKIIDFFKQRL